jgi:hypothetical protein
MSTDGKKRKRQAEVIDAAILAAKAAKNTAETMPLLAPLKGSMNSLIKLLESIKVSRRS